MEKDKILNILYAERNRLSSSYKLPGWSVWAFMAAIGAMGLNLLDIILDYHLYWNFVWAESFLLIDFVFLIFFVRSFFISTRSPLLQKSSWAMIIGELCIVSIYFSQIVWSFSVKDLISSGYWLGTAIFSDLVLTLLYAIVLVCCFFDTLKQQKPDKYACMLIVFYIIPVLFSVSFIYNNIPKIYLKQNIYAGLFIFAIALLFFLCLNDFKWKLKKMNSLIDDVLYYDLSDEKLIFERLEGIVLGNRVGRSITKNNKEEVERIVSFLLFLAESLYVHCKTIHINHATHDDVIASDVVMIQRNICILQNMNHYFKRISELSFDSKDKSEDRHILLDFLDYISNQIDKYQKIDIMFRCSTEVSEFVKLYIVYYEANFDMELQK